MEMPTLTPLRVMLTPVEPEEVWSLPPLALAPFLFPFTFAFRLEVDVGVIYNSISKSSVTGKYSKNKVRKKKNVHSSPKFQVPRTTLPLPAPPKMPSSSRRERHPTQTQDSNSLPAGGVTCAVHVLELPATRAPKSVLLSLTLSVVLGYDV